ncbi:MAG: hypothetical protein HXY35_03455 [Chloroflexi bacterium]|nr:hypothetical protein [Chloroflexota bacterium]
MNIVTRTTRASTLETLNENLKSAMRTHATTYGLGDSETSILMCCETISISRKHRLFGGIKTTLSAVYVTPKWLVWADSTGPRDASAGSAQLRHIDIRDYRTTASYAISPDQGLNITGRYTDRNRTGMTFIVLSSEPDGIKFRQILKEALGKAAK